MRYFAYGSNLCAEDVTRWCVENGQDARALRRVGPAYLPDHEPVFHYRSRARGGGALDLRARAGSCAAGALFEVDGWSILDLKEGPRYARVERTVLTDDGRAHRAATYLVRPEHAEAIHVPPTDAYLAIVLRGLASAGHSGDAVLRAARGEALEASPASIFVYGTLLRGESRRPILEAHLPREDRPASVRGALVDLGEYPGLIHGEGAVRGELVRFDDPARALEELDEVEGFEGYGREGSLYERVLVRAETEGSRVLAWTYLYARDAARTPRIASGDWRRRTAL